MDTNSFSAASAPCWSTAAVGSTANASAVELSGLGEHLHLCNRTRGALFGLQCAAETMNGFVAPRFVSTLVFATLLMSVITLVL